MKPFAFKHTGLFPEQATNWDWFGNLIKNANREIKVLNLFAYTGGATLAAATRLPMRYVYLAFTVGAVLMILAFIKMIPTKGKEILYSTSSTEELEENGVKKENEKEGEN